MAEFKLTQRQQEVWEMMAGPQRHTALIGGARSGKTFLIVRAIVLRACKAQKSRHAILRLRHNHVVQSVRLDTLPKVMELCFPQINRAACKFNDSLGFMRIPNGSEIWWGGLDDPERVDKILGQEHCVSPDSKVLTADLRWIAASDIQVGQELIAFPESIEGHMRLVRSTVTHSKQIQARRFRVVTTRGETIVSADHKFVAYKDDRRTRNFRSFSWVTAEKLQIGDKIRFACKPWDVGSSYDDGWLAGFYDGEGWIGGGKLGLAQNEGETLERAKTLLAARGISFRQHSQHGTGKNCQRLMTNSIWEALKVLGMIRPPRLLPKAPKLWEGHYGFNSRPAAGHGTGKTQKADPNGRHVATIIEIEEIERGTVIALTTTSGTLIADGFLGHNCSMFFNECSQIPYGSVITALTRLAQQVDCEYDPSGKLRQRAYFDLNPTLAGHYSNKLFVEHLDPSKRERVPVSAEDYVAAFVNPEDNAENLSEGYLKSLRNLPERQRRRFYEGRYVAEIDGQLWTIDRIDRLRIPKIDPTPNNLAQFERIVIAVDPSGASGPDDFKADEIGLVAAGRRRSDKHGVILEDNTGRYSPEQWGRIAWQMYVKWKADRVVGEKNFGGDMVRSIVQSAARFEKGSVAYQDAQASRGKTVRAEPIAAIYEREMFHHAGDYPELEEEYLNFTTAGYLGSGSPNHADAAIWAGWALFPDAGVLNLNFTKLPDLTINSNWHMVQQPEVVQDF